MSRSQYIWVVMATNSSLPVAAFTVKHELKRWLGSDPNWDKLRIYRMSGFSQSLVDVTQQIRVELDRT